MEWWSNGAAEYWDEFPLFYYSISRFEDEEEDDDENENKNDTQVLHRPSARGT